MPRVASPGPKGRGGSSFREALPDSAWEERRPALLRLFEDIASRYDRLNRYLSFGLDGRWRKWGVAALGERARGRILDLASGTAEMALLLLPGAGGPVLRCDLSTVLLRRGTSKLEKHPGGRGGTGRSSPAVACEMERLPLRDGSIDAVVQGFALRHCRSFDLFAAELFRVLTPGGRISLLDMRYPRAGAASGIYRAYFRRVLPRLAALLGGDRRAYELMVDSVRGLPPEEELRASFERAGFAQVVSRPGFLGAVGLITAARPKEAS